MDSVEGLRNPKDTKRIMPYLTLKERVIMSRWREAIKNGIS